MTQGSPRTPKVLICDDSQILNDLLKDVFEVAGFDVAQAFDGLQSKSVFLQEKPDVTFLDVRMPGADGLEVLRFITKKAPWALVVMMTGAGNEGVAVEAMKLGAKEYLSKPFETDQIVSLARRLLQQQEADQETKKLRNEIRRTERYLADLTRIISEAIVTTDSAGRIEFINLAGSTMWGYTEAELLGKDVHLLVRGEARTLLKRNLVKETIKSDRIEGEFQFRKKDGGSFPGYLSTSVIKEGKRTRGIVLVVADLTRLYEAERRLKQSEKLAALGRVVEGIAHEVRNCLTSLGGFATRLRKITAGDLQCDNYTRIMLADVARLEAMVREIEEFVRFSKFYSFDFRRIDVIPVVESALKRVREKLSQQVFKSISFRLKSVGNYLKIYADSSALEEVFFNLILNAYEAMPSGGRCTVLVSNLNSALSVAVSDTGVGMRAEYIDEIFNPFVTSKTSGAGMGLCKVQFLVEEHGGTVSVTSERNKGTTFEVFLPIERIQSGLFSGDGYSRIAPAR
jgi:PAS domain S-box-containing protein